MAGSPVGDVIANANQWTGNVAYEVSFNLTGVAGGMTFAMVITNDAGWDGSFENELLVNIIKAGINGSALLDSPTITKSVTTNTTL